jgi:hypothetical protein
MVATVWVRARLLTDRSPGATPITKPVTELPLDGFRARSLPGAAYDHTVELRMFLTMTGWLRWKTIARPRARTRSCCTSVSTQWSSPSPSVAHSNHEDRGSGQSRAAASSEMSVLLAPRVAHSWRERIAPRPPLLAVVVRVVAELSHSRCPGSSLGSGGPR